MDVVAHVVKYNSQTTGRDKLCRLFQYASKLACYHSKQHHLNDDLTEKFKILETNLSATRKVLRIGKSLDMIQGAIKVLSEKDSVTKVCLVIAKLNQAVYLLVDHYIWMAKTGLVKADAKKLSKLASVFWLVTLIANLARNIHDICCIIQRRNTKIAGEHNKAVVRNGQIGSPVEAVFEHPPVVVDTIKNTADLFLPLSSLGYLNLSDGTLGLLGMISSYMGVLATWNPSLKLVPS